jgi:adenylate cyclase
LAASGDNGLEAAERALELNPDLADAIAAKARVLAGLGRFEEALPLHERSLELDPDSYDVLFLYGRTCFQLGRHAEAIVHWERAAELYPDAIPVLTSIEMCYAATGQTDKSMEAISRAIERINRALARDASDTYALTYKVLGLAHLGEVEQAKQLALHIKAIEPDDPSIDYNIGCAMAILGETDLALDWLEGSLSKVDAATFAVWIRRDTDVDSLRGDSRFQQMVAELEARAAEAAKLA